MKTKEYAKTYLGNYNVLDVAEDLTDDFRVYLKLHDGVMNTTKFKNGVKEIFQKITMVSRHLELTPEQYAQLGKYFYAKVVLPSMGIYWGSGYEFSSAYRREHAEKEQKVRDNIRSSEPTGSPRTGSKARPIHFQNDNRAVMVTWYHRERTRSHVAWYESDFFIWFKEVVKPPFSLDRDVVIDERPHTEQQSQSTTHSHYSKSVLAAAEFFGVLEDLNELQEDQVKRSYRMLSKIHHPDVGGNVESFVKLTEHYNVLLEHVEYNNFKFN